MGNKNSFVELSEAYVLPEEDWENAQLDLIYTENDDDDNPDEKMRKDMERMIRLCQNHICNMAEQVDTEGKFSEDVYIRDVKTGKEGGGITRCMQNGKVFEKAAVNTSVLKGVILENQYRHMRMKHKSLHQALKGKGITEPLPFFAAGISVVIHPHSPFAPTAHAGYRYFDITLPDGTVVWWFGGGSDLTPTYVNDQDSAWFHRILREHCNDFDDNAYATMKEKCDQYFMLNHRKENRGIGGIFFDDLNDKPREEIFRFVTQLARNFGRQYYPIIIRHMEDPFTDEQKQWQQLRRGRFVEFSLIYDRGTKFGLSLPDPRTEAIMSSMPLTCRFEYGFEIAEGSPEQATVKALQTPRDWMADMDAGLIPNGDEPLEDTAATNGTEE